MAPAVIAGLSRQAGRLLARGIDAALAPRADPSSSDPPSSPSDPSGPPGPGPTVDPTHGVRDPHDLNNIGFYFLFALIGASFVLTGLWFFFWHRNGGFIFKEHDWDDYKSTVLRRTGPNGTILSGATRPTNLGGGSVYRQVADDNRTVVTESTGLSGITAGASDIFAREKRKRKQERRERERERGRRRSEKEAGSGLASGGGGGASASATSPTRPARHRNGEGIVIDEDAEKAAQEQLRNYRNEKSARVGGLNTQSDASVWDGSTNPTLSVASSEAGALLQNRDTPTKTTPKTTPTKQQRTSSSRNRDSAEQQASKRSSSHRRDRDSRDKDAAKGAKSSAKDREPTKSTKDRERESKTKDGKAVDPPAEGPSSSSPTKKPAAAAVSGGGNGSSGTSGIRKVYSTAERRDVREAERNRAEAKRAQDKGRAAAAAAKNAPSALLSGPENGNAAAPAGAPGHRRDFSWSKTLESDRMLEAPEPTRRRGGAAGDHGAAAAAAAAAGNSSEVGGTYVNSVVSEESGTKSYHHPMPELTALRGGYRRGRGEDYDE